MKKLIFTTLFVLASVFAVSAQQTQNQGVVAYNFSTSDVSVKRLNGTRFDSNTDSHGFTVGYTRFTKGKAGKVGTYGMTTEVTANIDSNEANQVTVMTGVVAQARNYSYVRPYARVLGGVARQHINRTNVYDTTDVSFALDGGVGVDFSPVKDGRYSFRTGFDVVNTSFNGERGNAYKFTAGIVF